MFLLVRQVEELPRDEGQRFAHMGIGALDSASPPPPL
eukprot:COSAG03_NODE_20787_length_313_cov_3.878505_2_plen_36_part_01